MTASSIIKQITSAGTCEELFGDDVSTPDELRDMFRDMAMLLHPDRNKTKSAASAMRKLTELKAEALEKIKKGTWGKHAPKPVTIKTSKQYEDVLPFAKGDTCDVYSGVLQTKAVKPTKVAIKIAREVRDADLLDREAEVLKYLWDGGQQGGKEFQHYIPKLIESARVVLAGKQFRINVLSLHDKRLTIAEIIRRWGPLQAADMAWIWRRMLEVLAFAHREGYVHGAVLPIHGLVDTARHSVRIIDWKNACKLERKDRIMTVSSEYEKWYPPEVFKKEPATPATDVYMAAKIASALCPKPPAAVQRLLDLCLQPSPRARFQDAWEVHEEFSKILKKLYGPPKFRDFPPPLTT